MPILVANRRAAERREANLAEKNWRAAFQDELPAALLERIGESPEGAPYVDVTWEAASTLTDRLGYDVRLLKKDPRRDWADAAVKRLVLARACRAWQDESGVWLLAPA